MTEIAKAITEAATIHHVTKKPNVDEKNKKTQNLAKHFEDLINYEMLTKIV